MTPLTQSPQFVVFEGGDETGKTTHSRWVAEQRGAQHTFEPSGEINLREVLLGTDRQEIGGATEALLFAADRCHHVSHVIRPALESGQDVICDRYIASSLAYQSYGRGLDFGDIYKLSEFASGGLMPDLTVLLHITYETYLARLADSDDSLTRFDQEAEEFHRRVIGGFAEMAEANPESWIVIDASRPVDEVRDAVAQALRSKLGWEL